MLGMSECMKLLITGTTGRLGGILARHFELRHDLLCPGRAGLDLTRPESLSAVLGGMTFDILINCAGITSPDVCAREPELAQLVNAESPAVMAAECQRRGVRMIQISTDYVFGGEVDTALTEDMETEPVNHYGITKLGGERAVLTACPEALVARVSWLFGGGNSFPEQMLRAAREGREVEAIGDKWSAPTSMHDIARWLELLWRKGSSATGVLHLCNSGAASWQSYAQEVLDLAHELGMLDHSILVKGNRLDEFPHFIARRPRHTLMSNERLAGLLGEPVRSWQEALREWMASQAA
jgi:dTDP-4-dehydrorhamnose reductase